MTQKFYTYLSFSLALLFFCSCNGDRDNTNQEALQNYKNFVTQVEKDTARAMNGSEPDSIWLTRTNTLLLQHDSLENQALVAKDYYSPEQEQEFEDLGNRFEEAEGKIKVKQEEISKRYKMRKDMLGLKVQTDDMSVLTAADLAPTYKHFVEQVNANYKNYTYTDWQLIEGWWNALSNRAEGLAKELTPEAQSEIEAARNEYIRIRKDANITQPAD